MTSVRAGDIVDVFFQLLAHTDSTCFLTRIEVNEAGNFAIAEFDMQPLLELANGLHAPVGLQ